MGRSAGAGSPVWLICPVARRNRDAFTYQLPPGHLLRRTGNEKPARHRGPMGVRSTSTLREVVCSCGHQWWTNHVDATNLRLAP